MSSAAIRTVLTGFALASSWTWCIGMFLPVLLGRMFGWPGILAFAIPNVLGCALFGFLRTRAQSQRETRDHALFMAIFSAATVAYQVFFVGWIVTPTLTATSTSTTSFGATIMLCGGFLAAAFALALLPRAWLWLLAAFAFPLSALRNSFKCNALVTTNCITMWTCTAGIVSPRGLARYEVVSNNIEAKHTPNTANSAGNAGVTAVCRAR